MNLPAVSLLVLLATWYSVAGATELEVLSPQYLADVLLDSSEDVARFGWHFDKNLVTYVDQGSNLTSLNDHEATPNLPSNSYFTQFRNASGIWAILCPWHMYQPQVPSMNFSTAAGVITSEAIAVTCHVFGKASVEIVADAGRVIGQILSECRSETDCDVKGFQTYSFDLREINEVSGTRTVTLLLHTVSSSDFILLDKVALLQKKPKLISSDDSRNFLLEEPTEEVRLDTGNDTNGWNIDRKLVTYLEYLSSDENLTLLYKNENEPILPQMSYWDQFKSAEGIWVVLYPYYFFEQPVPYMEYNYQRDFSLLKITCHLFGNSSVEVVDGSGKTFGLITSECQEEEDCKGIGFRSHQVELKAEDGSGLRRVKLLFHTKSQKDFILVDTVSLYVPTPSTETTVPANSTTPVPVCSHQRCYPQNLLDLDTDNNTLWTNSNPDQLRYFDTGRNAYADFKPSPDDGAAPRRRTLPDDVESAQGVWLFSTVFKDESETESPVEAFESFESSAPYFFLGDIGGYVTSYRPILRVAFEVYFFDIGATVDLLVMNREKEWTTAATVEYTPSGTFQRVEKNFESDDIVAVQIRPTVSSNLTFVLLDKLEADVDCDFKADDEDEICVQPGDGGGSTSTDISSFPTSTEASPISEADSSSPKPTTGSPGGQSSSTSGGQQNVILWRSYGFLMVVFAILMVPGTR